MTVPPAATIPQIVLLPVALGAAGVLLFIFALRGRRVDDHPICRKCRFDLHGRPGDSTRCPECGSDLSRRRAVRVGNRVRRRRLAAAAVAVFLLSAGGAGLAGWGCARGVDWNRHKPDWWLARDAGSPAPAVRDAALAELARRAAEGRLPAGREAALVEEGLAYQADPAKPWAPAWGQFVEAVRDGGRMSEGRWDRYATQAAGFTLDVRPRVRQGDPVPFRIRGGPNRVVAGKFAVGIWFDDFMAVGNAAGGGTRLGIDERMTTFPEFPVLGRPHPYDVTPAAARSLTVEGVGEWTGEATSRLAPGPQTARIGARVWRGRPEGGRAVSLEAPFVLLAADEPSVRLDPDPSLRPAVERSLSVQGLTSVEADDGSRRLVGFVYGNGAPAALAYRVFVRLAGREVESDMDAVLFRPRGGGCRPVAVPVGRADPKSVDVLLRPAPAAASRTIDVAAVWGGDVVIEGVPVRRR